MHLDDVNQSRMAAIFFASAGGEVREHDPREEMRRVFGALVAPADDPRGGEDVGELVDVDPDEHLRADAGADLPASRWNSPSHCGSFRASPFIARYCSP